MDRGVRFAGASVLLAAATGCVTTDLDPIQPSIVPASSVVIPFTGGSNNARNPLGEYYGSVMFLLQDAVLERSPERIRELCTQHDRASAPDWARQQIAHYRGIAQVIETELFLARDSRLELRGEIEPALGERIPLVFRVPVGDVRGVTLPAGEGPLGAHFHVQLEIVDVDCLGGRVERGFSEVLDLPAAAEVGTAKIELPFDVDAVPPEGVLRQVRARVSLLPGNVRLGSAPMPNRRVRCVTRELTIYPRGIDRVRSDPFRTLKNALRSPETRHLDNMYLAACLMPIERRAAAVELLIGRVRNGDRVQARACMAALSVLTEASVSVDDRRGWLRWWNARATRAK